MLSLKYKRRQSSVRGSGGDGCVTAADTTASTTPDSAGGQGDGFTKKCDELNENRTEDMKQSIGLLRKQRGGNLGGNTVGGTGIVVKRARTSSGISRSNRKQRTGVMTAPAP